MDVLDPGTDAVQTRPLSPRTLNLTSISQELQDCSTSKMGGTTVKRCVSHRRFGSPRKLHRVRWGQSSVFLK